MGLGQGVNQVAAKFLLIKRDVSHAEMPGMQAAKVQVLRCWKEGGSVIQWGNTNNCRLR